MALIVFVGTCVIGLPLLMIMLIMGNSEVANQCGTGSVALAGGSSADQLNVDQRENASTVISEGRRLGVSEQGIRVALTVVSQESNFLNYANDGTGDLAPEQAGIEESLQLPHQAVGSDHGSVGIFQQQWPWWGSLSELMDPATSARKFYAALLDTPGWERMDTAAAAQAVQRSAFPHAYDDDVARADALLEGALDSSGIEEAVYFGGRETSTCAAGNFSGQVSFPLPGDATYVDQVNYGHAGGRWDGTHTGTDLATSCGTPVLAATDGMVTVRTDQSWAGRWLVQVDSGGGGVVTWYAHMQEIGVDAGDRVQAGQEIGKVGSLGNSTGCHLHFEVHPGGGDPVNPTDWLAKNKGKGLGDGSVVPASASGVIDVPTDKVVLMTANIPFWRSDRVVESRIRQLLARKPDVLLLQEMRPRNVAAMVARAPGRWGAWQPHGVRNRNAIVWNADTFTVTRKGVAFGVDAGPYETWMPWALLEGDSGTLPVVGIHMPTNSSKDPRMRAYFKQMTTRYLRLFSKMNQAGYPPIVGGDWNHPLGAAREPWSPVPQLRRVGLTTNWRHGQPCAGTSANNGRIDGFAYNSGYLRVVDQGCLDSGPSDHRPLWVAVAPSG